jgi:hypothetical protein
LTTRAKSSSSSWLVFVATVEEAFAAVGIEVR